MKVSRGDWNVRPMASSRPLAYERSLTRHELAGLVAGFKPACMDDKWFIFSENGAVHFHRSWSGEEIYAVTLVETPDGAEIARVMVNNDYPDDADAIVVLDLLFEEILPQYYGE